MSWLLDTLVWTGALISVVLLVRRPVARHFGARIAYALWALPLLRLVVPPIVLPASMAPAPEPQALAAVETVYVAEVVDPASLPAAPAGPDWWAILTYVWVAGALAYVALRLLAYRRLRNELLADAYGVGNAGKVRLVETPATRSPLAFGLIDKVIALPPGFMAQTDRVARDLALAHELAHHRAHDLAANFAALPLFALHWFNPLSWLGWTAMRRDQEAACDARVVEGRERAERAFYATLIADTVAAPKFALAAPMACPVLGDKSIIHRLRNLTMTDHSLRRRRAGVALVGLAALALPLTASFSYAQVSAPEAPPAPPAPAAPAAPLPPEAAPAPEAPAAPADAWGPESDVRHVIVARPDGDRVKTRHVTVVRHVDGDHVAHSDGKPGKRRVLIRRDGKELNPDSPEFQAEIAALEKRMESLGEEIGSRVVIDEKRVERMAALAGAAAERAARAGARAERMAPIVVEACDGKDGVSESRAEDGRRVFRVCRTKLAGGARSSLRAARATIAGNTEMSAETRAKVLEELDREIARLEKAD